MIASDRPLTHVFCGPTISAGDVAKILPRAVTHPPVRHGDLLRLELRPVDVVVIIDGVFHHVGSIRHKEILEVMARGVTVIGASSMGALRAAELHRFGMIGVGAIFAAYRDGYLDADDEVAVACAPDSDMRLSEAMVDIQAMLRAAADSGVLSRADADAIAKHAAVLSYVERTWTAVSAATRTVQPELKPALDRLDRWRAEAGTPAGAKYADALAALRLAAAPIPQAGPASWAGPPWPNHFLREWIADFGRYDATGADVSLTAVLRHQQLYDRDFPRRWRRFVLSWIAGGDFGNGTEARAASVAEASGITAEHLSRAQVGHWLTTAEIASLDGAEKLLRILVRAVPQDRSTPIWPVSRAEAGDLINPAMGSVPAATAAARLNSQVSQSGPGRSIWQLRTSHIRRHLARQWELTRESESEMTAAARDRGFSGLDSAVAAGRTYFLAATGYPGGSPG
jgi:hypothetical protein